MKKKCSNCIYYRKTDTGSLCTNPKRNRVYSYDIKDFVPDPGICFKSIQYSLSFKDVNYDSLSFSNGLDCAKAIILEKIRKYELENREFEN